MIARRVEDLIVWRLANDLKRQVHSFTAKLPEVRDFDDCDQIRDACASVTRNTAEGFGRFRPKEFRHFLRIAAGSLHEVKDALHDGQDRRYLTEGDHVHLRRLTLRALKANSRLQAYLKRCDPEGPGEHP
jgi:four helix bundle protein